ncbi:hypothetical protein N0V85_004494 [Neurospora sp. IMI 360204]|nr:hypothetical protein N0V85_004494 [Neurospora sp. IMI 360204]
MLSKVCIVGLLQALTVLNAATATPLAKRDSSCNTPENRACWADGFNIRTDYDEKTPLTGRTVNYTLVLEQYESYTGPDGGIKHDAMLFNGSFPGPTITADWGDWINVTVINKLLTNGYVASVLD